jgi:hypothetical protein
MSGWVKPPAPVFTSWDELPLMVPIEQVAALYGKSTRAIVRLVRLEQGIPAPILTRPLRWSRADLQAHWEKRQSGVTRSRQRFARA